MKFNSSLLRQFDEMNNIAQGGGQVMDTRPNDAFKGKGDGKISYCLCTFHDNFFCKKI